MCIPAWEHSSEIRSLASADVRIRRDTFNRLNLEVGGEIWSEGVRPVQPFPLTAPGCCVLVRDEDGREMGVVEDVEQLEDESKEEVHRELENEYFTSRVVAISSVRSRHGVTTWDLVTERGNRQIHVKDRTDIRKLPEGRIVLTDVHGMKFDIPDIAQLDRRSRAFLGAET